MNYKLNNYTSEQEFFNDIKESYVSLDIQDIAISGGSSLSIFDSINPTKTTNIYLCDERFVDESNPKSNYYQAKQKISTHINSWEVSKYQNILKCINEYERSLPVSFDLIVLGVGSDGHTCSLFPNTQALESQDLCTHNTTDVFDIKDRMTFTYEAIKRTKKVWVILIDKPDVITQIQNNKISYKDFPIKKVFDICDTIIFHLNTKATS